MNSKDEIKKGLDICSDFSADCHGCPYFGPNNCGDVLKTDAHDLITEQEKEIKQLKTECVLLDDELRNARQDTINVLNKLKEKYGFCSCYSFGCDVKPLNEIIDEFIKEVLNAED